MSILGHPTTGWFARLANGVESGGRWVGNLVTGGSGGDRFYDNMGHHANTYVENVNNQVIAQATANGATPQQALQAGSAAMDSLANPSSVGDFAQLGGAGVQVATNTVADALPSIPSPDLGGLILAGLALGGTVLACEAFNGSSSPTPSNRDRGREAAYA